MREDRPPIQLARKLRQAMTPQETKLWNWLREGFGPQGFRFRRQAPLGPFVVDFVCIQARLVIEVDGGQHGLPSMERKDRLRDAALERLGYRVLRFWNHEIDREKQVVMDTIFARLTESAPPSVACGDTSTASGGGSAPRFDPSPLAGRVAAAGRRVGPVEMGFLDTRLTESAPPSVASGDTSPAGGGGSRRGLL